MFFSLLGGPPYPGYPPMSSASKDEMPVLPMPTVNPRENDFCSDIFTIVVSSERRTFFAHREILSKSPKFAAQCNNEHFTESKTRRIELPSDDPTVFSLLLEYLYHTDYWPRIGNELGCYGSGHSDRYAVRADRVWIEATLYTMAGYNQLPELQKLAGTKIAALGPLPIEGFLDVAKFIYSNCSVDNVFRRYFRQEIRRSRSHPLVQALADDECDELRNDLLDAMGEN